MHLELGVIITVAVERRHLVDVVQVAIYRLPVIRIHPVSISLKIVSCKVYLLFYSLLGKYENI